MHLSENASCDERDHQGFMDLEDPKNEVALDDSSHNTTCNVNN